MKKTIYSVLFAAGILMAGSSCSDYLETNTTSKADASLVFSTNETARAALEGAYTSWTDAGQNKVIGDGLFYAADVAGSDIERHPENFSNQPGRHYPVACLAREVRHHPHAAGVVFVFASVQPLLSVAVVLLVHDSAAFQSKLDVLSAGKSADHKRRARCAVAYAEDVSRNVGNQSRARRLL